MQREDFLSIWISLKTYQLRGIPTTLETKINHKINIHTNIFQKNHKKEFGPRLTEKRNSIGLQRVKGFQQPIQGSTKFFYRILICHLRFVLFSSISKLQKINNDKRIAENNFTRCRSTKFFYKFK